MVKSAVSTLVFVMCAVLLAQLAQAHPSYAIADGDQQLRGRIVSFNGAYNMMVRDEQGNIDRVELHEGTIINPTGLTLEPGMVISVLGYNAGPYFAANEIDTPYTIYGGFPYYLGHPWTYYNTGFNTGFFFNNTGWWHGSAFYGGYHYAGHARAYPNVHVGQIYHAHPGGFQGHDFIAPHESGGYHAAHFGGGHFGGAHFGGHGGGHGHP